jgi:hypothetical protein
VLKPTYTNLNLLKITLITWYIIFINNNQRRILRRMKQKERATFTPYTSTKGYSSVRLLLTPAHILHGLKIVAHASAVSPSHWKLYPVHITTSSYYFFKIRFNIIFPPNLSFFPVALYTHGTCSSSLISFILSATNVSLNVQIMSAVVCALYSILLSVPQFWAQIFSFTFCSETTQSLFYVEDDRAGVASTGI